MVQPDQTMQMVRHNHPSQPGDLLCSFRMGHLFDQRTGTPEILEPGNAVAGDDGNEVFAAGFRHTALA